MSSFCESSFHHLPSVGRQNETVVRIGKNMAPSLSRQEKKLSKKISCPAYHINSPLNRQPGYYPNLTSVQKESILQIKAKLKAAGFSLSPSLENDNLRILRFLRAKRFDVNETFEMLWDNSTWYEREGIESLVRTPCQQVLRCPPHECFSISPWWFQGEDRQCRPIVWGGCGHFEVWKLTALTPCNSLLRLHIWGCIQLERRLEELSKRTGRNIETIVVVLDAEGWNLGLATQESFSFIRSLVEASNLYFPERLGDMLIINAPPVLAFAWKVISGFLDYRTREKVQILNHRDEWFPVLMGLVDVSQVPRKYGGAADDLSAAQAVSSMHHVDMTSAENTDEKLRKNTSAGYNSDRAIGNGSNNNDDDGDGDGDNGNTGGGNNSGGVGAKPPQCNLTILRSTRRHRSRSRTPHHSPNVVTLSLGEAEHSSSSSWGSLHAWGRWISESLKLHTSLPVRRRSRRRRRRKELDERRHRGRSAESEEMDDSSDSGSGSCSSSGSGSSRSSNCSSWGSHSSSHSSGSGSGSSVYDEEGGNVIHCRSEDNLTPVSPNAASIHNPADSWTQVEGPKWKFNASTQTDISSFDPIFYPSRKKAINWPGVFSCFKREGGSRKKIPMNDECK